MKSDVIVENVFSTISLVFWTVQLLPQVYHNFRRESTAGSAVGMMSLWFLAGVILCPYMLYLKINIPMILQPNVFAFLCLVCVVQDVYYDSNLTWRIFFRQNYNHEHVDDEELVEVAPNEIDVDDDHKKPADNIPRDYTGWKLLRTGIVCLAFCAVWSAILLGFYFALMETSSKVILFVLALGSGLATLIGFIPQYVLVFKTKSCLGLSRLFLLLDFFGGIFGILSLAFKGGNFDYLTAFLYISVSVGDFGLLILTCVYK